MQLADPSPAPSTSAHSRRPPCLAYPPALLHCWSPSSGWTCPGRPTYGWRSPTPEAPPPGPHSARAPVHRARGDALDSKPLARACDACDTCGGCRTPPLCALSALGALESPAPPMHQDGSCRVMQQRLPHGTALDRMVSSRHCRAATQHARTATTGRPSGASAHMQTKVHACATMLTQRGHRTQQPRGDQSSTEGSQASRISLLHQHEKTRTEICSTAPPAPQHTRDTHLQVQLAALERASAAQVLRLLL
jgi:hypothetical protein